ncbi:uncharacterized protein LOC123892995 [Trifolium pratense]|uniref:uncharacterized protein LOC123892995 n=1 Tax=Trifolium pratense TaxID=57577 RepID=UPI001E695CD8|nr:uncharacterized protein LOC123892995 [Trifolium pratense]
MANPEAKLDTFLQWLQANGVELRGCNIKYCDSIKGFGIFSDKDVSDAGILLVVPLELAITPMRVLQDPFLGPECRALFEEGDVDDRLLMMLLLTVERLRKGSLWKPYLDMLPTTFGNTLWFSEEELQELRGTTLYRATELQKKSLLNLYETKVKDLVKKLLNDGNSEIEVCFEDFLWANSVFWSRALNIPLPRSYVFPEMQNVHQSCTQEADEKGNQVIKSDDLTKETTHSTVQGDTVWVEGLVPGIDFCNHDLKPIATWEVDGTGITTGVPVSMYLLSATQSPSQIVQEISISYGNKGNEELLYLYGFVIDGNKDDYLMVHYPTEAINTISFSESKGQLLEVQNAEMRCLLPKTLLDNGFFPLGTENSGENKKSNNACNYSWSGQRKFPSYVNKLVFPEKFMATLRTIAMQEDELFKVSSMLEELVGPEGERQLSDTDVQSAIWEVCGDSGALQVLVDLLHVKLMDLEEHSGTEESDSELLKKALIIDSQEDSKQMANESAETKLMTRNKWSAIVYRRGQKQLTRLFLKEAEHALQLSMNEEISVP